MTGYKFCCWKSPDMWMDYLTESVSDGGFYKCQVKCTTFLACVWGRHFLVWFILILNYLARVTYSQWKNVKRNLGHGTFFFNACSFFTSLHDHVGFECSTQVWYWKKRYFIPCIIRMLKISTSLSAHLFSIYLSDFAVVCTLDCCLVWLVRCIICFHY